MWADGAMRFSFTGWPDQDGPRRLHEPGEQFAVGAAGQMTDENGQPVVKAGRCDENALRVLRLASYSLQDYGLHRSPAAEMSCSAETPEQNAIELFSHARRTTSGERRKALQKADRPGRAGRPWRLQGEADAVLAEAEALKLRSCLKGQILWKMDLRHRDFASSRLCVNRDPARSHEGREEAMDVEDAGQKARRMEAKVLGKTCL